MINIGKKEGLEGIKGKILRDSGAMQTIATKVGFSLHKTADFVKAELEL
ncbi:MAG: hypothetical protein ACK47N_08890 [Microcystis sp.]|jgi:acetyltransferase|uniref:Uncharacterized protein n=1 Tax=Microcystis wesenbergii NRERC-220 TaxID=3068991 RepID=A0ABU3HJ67_9CHRO|nr:MULTISPECIES: hypothetical protein [Microcystis]MCZ8038960.1 hypothetical protein [Microcystis sp. LE17-20A]MCZ8213052.1 hypothetical protein [Microcystis sp. LE19-8.1F]MDT3674575.1 hypothetical protein [Microcystis wesenbergii NRERC-220]UZO77488.1 hypothetical protein M8120_05820 [Microcystis aeruginosa str. Chao 1910]